MNELKQIRTMAEMIIEKVDALGATPFYQNGFREFVPEVNVWMPKFAIGDTVYYTPDGSTEEWTCTIKKIHSTYNSYEVVSHDGRHETWVAEKFLRSEPKLNPGPQFDRDRNGSLYDRGGADSVYGRSRDPHWYPEGTYKGDPVKDLTPHEIAEYNAGYDACGGPKFAVGDCVGTTVGDQGRVTGIHKLDGHYRYRYLVLFDNGNHHHVAEPLLELIKPEPKFKVGDRVVYDFDGTTKLGTVNKISSGGWYIVVWDDGTGDGTGDSMNESFNWVRLATENDREWHSGPPPYVGWWNASNTKNLGAWRWWNGEAWSWLEYDCSSDLATIGQTVNATSSTSFKWTYYWPENARVARAHPDEWVK